MTGDLQLATPERVAVELPIAGLGSRVMAYLVDVLLLGTVALVAYFALTLVLSDPVDAALGLAPLARNLFAAATFVVLWGYWTILEVTWNGQTPGKRLVGIRVVRIDGSPVTVFASAVRNLLRVVDFMPACYPVGIITMLIDRKHRRVGDLLAGTVLVRDEKVDLERYAQVSTGSTVTVPELELALNYLSRFDALEPSARLRVGKQVAARLGLPDSADATTLRDAIRTRLEAR